jgi:hypothetical protein
MTDIQTTITSDLAWLKSHLILLAVVTALVFGAVYGIEKILASHDAIRETKDAQVLTLITQQTTDLKEKLAQDEQAASARDAQYTAIITQLSGTIQKQHVALQHQITVNASLTASQTAQAISQKTQAQPGEVSAQGDNVTLDLPIARIINNDLDILSTVQTQLDETKQQLIAQTGLTSDAILDSVNAKKVIVSQAGQISQADKVCQDTVKTIKADARKSKLRWFIAGLLTGIIGGRYL